MGAFQDLLNRVAVPPLLDIPKFKVIEESLFRPQDGFCGWEEHGSSAGSPPLSLTRLPSLSGANSLMISTGPKRSSTKAGFSTAIKRLSRIQPEEGTLRFEVWFCYRAEKIEVNPANIVFAVDTQLYDNSARAFPQIRWARFLNTGEQPHVNKFQLINDAGALVDVPACTWDLGENEGKHNWYHVEAAFKYTPSDICAYSGLTVQGQKYDVSGLGAGHKAESPQVGTSSFAGGFNLLITVQNRNNGDNGCAEAFIGKTRTTLELP